MFTNKQKLRLKSQVETTLSKGLECNILMPNIAGISHCCCGVAWETVKPIPSSSGGSVGWLTHQNHLPHGLSGMRFNLTYPLWYVHSCGNTGCINKYLIWCLNLRLMLDVNEEETTTINVVRSFEFRELLLHYKLCIVHLLILSILKLW